MSKSQHQNQGVVVKKPRSNPWTYLIRNSGTNYVQGESGQPYFQASKTEPKLIIIKNKQTGKLLVTSSPKESIDEYQPYMKTGKNLESSYVSSDISDMPYILRSN